MTWRWRIEGYGVEDSEVEDEADLRGGEIRGGSWTPRPGRNDAFVDFRESFGVLTGGTG